MRARRVEKCGRWRFVLNMVLGLCAVHAERVFSRGRTTDDTARAHCLSRCESEYEDVVVVSYEDFEDFESVPRSSLHAGRSQPADILQSGPTIKRT